MDRFHFHKLIIFLLVVLSLSGCRKGLQDEEVIYQNSFDKNASEGTEGLRIHTYSGNRMAGNYNNGSFSLVLDGLKKHDYIKISFDLYIHDYWDGNNTGNKEVATGPDIWSMMVDNEYIINTTFSNTVCNAIYCLLQSYPKNYPFQNDPMSAASNTTLPGLCAGGGISTLYHIEKLIKHDKSRVSIKFEDMLQQSNVPDQKCDESWSLDNLKISTLSTN